MNQIDVRKGLIDNAEQGISEAEKRFYQSYDDRIVQVKSGLTTPGRKRSPEGFPRTESSVRSNRESQHCEQPSSDC